jgi:fucose permease
MATRENSREDRALRGRRTSVLIVFALSGLVLASWLSRVPSVRDDLDATTFGMGVLALGISIGSIGGFATASRLGSRVTPQHIITISLIVAMAGALLAGLGASVFASYPVTMVGLVVLGLGNGTCNVTMNVEGAAVEREADRPLMPWFHASFSIGAVVGAGLGAVAAALDISPALHLGAIVTVMAVCTAVAVRHLSRTPAAARRRRPSRIERARGAAVEAGSRSAWLESRTIAIGLVVVGMSFANGAANDWIALAMVDGHGTGDGIAALAVDIFTVGVVAARLAGVQLLGRLGRVRTVQVSALVAVTGLLVFVLAPGTTLALVGAALWGLGVSLAFPIGMSAAADEPAAATRRIAVVAAMGYSGSLVGPPLIGFVAGASGILHALFIVLVLMVVAGILAPVLRPKRVFSAD